MRSRIKLVRDYNLAGVASWRKGFEEAYIWDVIKEELNKRP
jgi:spore germination protein YaaH